MRTRFTRNRLRIIAYADRQIVEARQLWTDDDGYLSPCGWHRLCEHLHQSRKAYRAAGLGLLSARIGWLHRRVMNHGMAATIDERVEVRSLWAFFDRLNAATVATWEGGRA